MKRIAVVLMLLVALAIGGRQLPSLLAQNPPSPVLAAPVPAPQDLDVPSRGDVLIRDPVTPKQPMINPNGTVVAVPAQSSFVYGTTTQDSRPPDPRVVELTARYNQLEQQVMSIAREFRQTRPEGQDREPLRQKIAELTQQQFTIRHDIRRFEIERLQNQLKELQEKLQRREEMKSDIIDRRVAQLTDQDDELRWEPLTPPSVQGGGSITFSQSLLPDLVPSAGLPSPVPALPAAGQFGWSLPTRGAAPAQVPAAPNDPNNLPIANPPQSVREAQVRLEMAQRELQRVKAQFEVGMIESRELNRAEDAVRLGQIALEEAQQMQLELIKVKELDLRKTSAELDTARAEFEAFNRAYEGDRTFVNEAAMRKAKAVLAEKEVELERAKTMLELQHQRAKELEKVDDSNDELTPSR